MKWVVGWENGVESEGGALQWHVSSDVSLCDLKIFASAEARRGENCK